MTDFTGEFSNPPPSLIQRFKNHPIVNPKTSSNRKHNPKVTNQVPDPTWQPVRLLERLKSETEYQRQNRQHDTEITGLIGASLVTIAVAEPVHRGHTWRAKLISFLQHVVTRTGRVDARKVQRRQTSSVHSLHRKISACWTVGAVAGGNFFDSVDYENEGDQAGEAFFGEHGDEFQVSREFEDHDQQEHDGAPDSDVKNVGKLIFSQKTADFSKCPFQTNCKTDKSKSPYCSTLTTGK